MNMNAGKVDENLFDDNDEVEIEEADDGIEIDVVDDTPEQDRNRPRRPDGAEPNVPDDDEIEQYSDKVQKRIKALKYEFHEERRRKEAAEREANEAVQAAKRLKEEADRYRKALHDGESVLADQASGRVEALIAQAKREYKEAYEEGDAEKLAEASAKIAGLQGEFQRVKAFSEQVRNRPKQEQYEPQPEQPKQKPNKPSARAETWARDNSDWFQVDPEMTGYAFGVHERLVRGGLDPESDEYYRQIDQSMRKVFPDRFDDGGEARQKKPANVVASAERAPRSPRKVRLTQTQVKLAEKLGLTKEQYAEALLDEMKKAKQ